MFQVCWMKERQCSHLTAVENPAMLHVQVGNIKAQHTYAHSLENNIFKKKCSNFKFNNLFPF
jgi:hypothetical protein